MSAKAEIPVGQKFGELTIIGRAPNPGHSGGCFVFARCDCGTETRLSLRSIVNRGVSRCSTSKHFDRDRIAQGESLLGRRFGALVVIGAVADAIGRGKSQVLVKCDCGAERYAVVNHLMRGNIASCGGDAHRTIKIQATRWKRPARFMTYALEAVGTDLIKIGSAYSIKDRLTKLQYPCPVELKVFATSDENIERRLHQVLAEYRMHGEWFRKCPEVESIVMALMTPVAISVLDEIGIGSRGRTRGRQHRCKRCGGMGHHAKTCARPLVTPPESPMPS